MVKNNNQNRKRKITLSANEQGIQRAEKALLRLGFGTKTNFAKANILGRSTVSKFFTGKPIQLDSFQKICEILTLNWQEIANIYQPPIVVLVGDISTTGIVLGLVQVDLARNQEKTFKINFLYKNDYVLEATQDLNTTFKKFLEDSKKTLLQEYNPEKACLSVAGIVKDNTCQLTNVNLTINQETLKELEQELGLSKIILINDFVAAAYGVLNLELKDKFILHEGKPKQKEPIAIIGSRIGLGWGQSFIIPCANNHFKIISGEGGHGYFTSRNDQEYELYKYLQEEKAKEVSVEEVISGMSIISIYQFFRNQKNMDEFSEEITQKIKDWETNKKYDQVINIVETIIEQAIQSSDSNSICQKTIKLFVEAYGAEARNLALKLPPYGGLYLAGDIEFMIKEFIKTSEFLKIFFAEHLNELISSYLKEIPIYIVAKPSVGLMGAARYMVEDELQMSD